MREESKCITCKDRYPGCHPRCEYYKEYERKKKEEKERIKKAKMADQMFASLHRDNLKRMGVY